MVALVCVSFWGCVLEESPDATQPATPSGSNPLPQGCNDAAQAAMCPPGSAPLTGREAFDVCQGRSDIQITDNTGAISAICEGQGACLVVCNLQDPCSCGIERIDNEGVFCVPCDLASACGNAICEGGEDPESCPVDCAAECLAEQGRCLAGELQLCQSNGSWSTVPCRADQSCEVSSFAANMSFCQTSISPSGGSRPTIAPAPSLDWAPSDIAYFETPIDCLGGDPRGCFTVGLTRGPEVFAVGSGGVVHYNPITGEGEVLDGAIGLP